jgi:hypothetical protein
LIDHKHPYLDTDSTANFLTNLPNEVLVAVMCFLPLRSLLHFSRTSKRLNALVYSDSYAWKNVDVTASGITDSIVERFCGDNIWNQTKSLKLSRCHKITNRSLKAINKVGSSLETLCILSYGN